MGFVKYGKLHTNTLCRSEAFKSKRKIHFKFKLQLHTLWYLIMSIIILPGKYFNEQFYIKDMEDFKAY